jgi:acyl carrier protein
MFQSVSERLLSVLEQNGVYISNDWDEELEFDSITFISTIVGIETEFDLVVPDEFLLLEKFKTFRMYTECIDEIIVESQSG